MIFSAKLISRFGRSWPFMAFHGHSWHFMAKYGQIWPNMIFGFGNPWHFA